MAAPRRCHQCFVPLDRRTSVPVTADAHDTVARGHPAYSHATFKSGSSGQCRRRP
jgi:hypothetical protein